jgi:hypothetical protein
MKFKRNLLILSAILIGVLILAAGCMPAPTTPVLDTDAPKLSTAVYTDLDSNGTVNKGDRVVFTFDEEMLTSTVTSTNVATSLLLSAGSYGTTGLTVSWNTAGTVCTVILGTSPTIVSGTTVNPASSVTDTAGNADASSAVTISGLTAITILSSVSISPSTYPAIAGSSTTKTFTASALSTAATTMTSSCTFTWSITGVGGTISTTSGTITVYTPASSAGTDTITVTAVKTGTTTPIKTATATITVGTTTPPTPTVDPAKLFVSDQTGKAKYTALPAGAISVTVYSHATADPVAAVAAGARATITLNDVWTTVAGITANDYIYFMIAYSDGTTSSITADGQLPDAPDGPGAGTALDSIQATSKNTVTSSAAGNVVATDNITLYILGVQKSNPAPVGSPMTFVYDLVATDIPKYTRTNANGHESAVSGADGQILELFSAADADVGGSPNVLNANDILTLGFTGGANVTVTADITVSDIIWVTTGAALLDDGTGNLAGTGAGTTVVLTATATYADFTGAETVTFNISDTIPIVDTTGGNQVLPRATGFTFTGGASF